MVATTYVHLGIRLTPAERRAIRRAALELDVSASALARRALLDYLARIASDPATRSTREPAR
jgi:hypothetical protein